MEIFKVSTGTLRRFSGVVSFDSYDSYDSCDSYHLKRGNFFRLAVCVHHFHHLHNIENQDLYNPYYRIPLQHYSSQSTDRLIL